MSTSVQANDARIVDLLGFDEDISRTLGDSEIAVVTRGQQRRSYIVPNDATRAQRPVLRTVEFMSLFFSRQVSASLLSFRRQRRNGSLRAHDQRSTLVPRNPGLEPVQPELGMIVMHILCGRARNA